MKPAVGVAAEGIADEKHQLVSELFHALSQPITALRCSLELAVYAQIAPSKENLQTALAHAEQIAQLASGIRELIQADDPGDVRAELVLEDYIREAVGDMQAIVEVSQVEVEFTGRLSGRVVSEPRRLKQALFYWLEFALLSAAAGSVLNLVMSEQDKQGIVTLSLVRKKSVEINLISAADHETKSQKLSRRLGLAIAGRIFESAGGGLQVQEDEANLHLRFYLPLAR